VHAFRILATSTPVYESVNILRVLTAYNNRKENVIVNCMLLTGYSWPSKSFIKNLNVLQVQLHRSIDTIPQDYFQTALPSLV
jgi:hypothetical protein